MIFGSISTQLNTLTKPEPSTTAVSLGKLIPPLIDHGDSWTTRRVLGNPPRKTLKDGSRPVRSHCTPAQADGR